MINSKTVFTITYIIPHTYGVEVAIIISKVVEIERIDETTRKECLPKC